MIEAVGVFLLASTCVGESTMASNSVTTDRSSERTDDLRSRRIEEAAAARLRRTGYPQIREITCFHQSGRLTLYGVLPSYYLKQLAQTAVADIDGVKTVTNEIDVVAPGPTSGWRPGSL